MSRYNTYFSKLREHHSQKYSRGSDLTPQEDPEMSNRMLLNKLLNPDYNANLHLSDTDNANHRRSMDTVGGLELLNRPAPLPLSYYEGKETPETMAKMAEKEKEQREKQRIRELLFNQGFGTDPNTGKPTHPSHSLHHDNQGKKIKVNTQKGSNSQDKLLQGLVDSGLATVETQHHTLINPLKKQPKKLKEEISREAYSKLSMDAQLDYDKKIATLYRDKGLGAYRPPKRNTKPNLSENYYKKADKSGITFMPNPKPPPRQDKPNPPVSVVSPDLPPPPPPDTSGIIF